MGHEASFRSKAAHFVSDLTTVILNPIADDLPSSHKNHEKLDENQKEEKSGQGPSVTVDGPDTSSFSAFLVSLLSSEKNPDAEMSATSSDIQTEENQSKDMGSTSDSRSKERRGRRSLMSYSKRSVKRVMKQVVRIGGYGNQNLEVKTNSNVENNGYELKHLNSFIDVVSKPQLPEISEPSVLLSEDNRSSLYLSLPSVVREKKWILLYSTWRHGISLSTLYRRSTLCPGYSLLVVGDQKGAVFGGLVEVPLKPTAKKKYQGTHNTFVFSNKTNTVVVNRPTGANRYFTACATNFLALGGGGHFALYLDADLLTGSSSASETYGNSCLAFSQDFEVKEVELWGFVYASKYDEILALSQTETPGICRWVN